MPKLLEGRWLSPDETGVVVVNQIARNNTVPDLGAGDSVQLLIGGRPTTRRVVGIAEEKGGGSSVYATAAGFAAATGQPPRANQLRIAPKPVFLALDSLFVAALPTLALTALLGAGLGSLFFSAPLPYRISPLAIGIWTSLVILGAILATEAAATRASRLTVREALAYL